MQTLTQRRCNSVVYCVVVERGGGGGGRVPLSRLLQLMEVKHCNMRLLVQQQQMQLWVASEAISPRETTGVDASFNKTLVITSLDAVIFRRSGFFPIVSIFNSQG